MANYLEFIGNETLLSDEIYAMVVSQLQLSDAEQKDDGNYSGWSCLFNVHTHYHENPNALQLNTVISLRLRDRSRWHDSRIQAVTLLNSILQATECDLQFYSFWHLKFYRRNGGANLCRMPGVNKHRQFWNDQLKSLLQLKYEVIDKDYVRF